MGWPHDEYAVEAAVSEFMRIALERDARSLSFLGEGPTHPAPGAPPLRPRNPSPAAAR